MLSVVVGFTGAPFKALEVVPMRSLLPSDGVDMWVVAGWIGMLLHSRKVFCAGPWEHTTFYENWSFPMKLDKNYVSWGVRDRSTRPCMLMGGYKATFHPHIWNFRLSSAREETKCCPNRIHHQPLHCTITTCFSGYRIGLCWACDFFLNTSLDFS